MCQAHKVGLVSHVYYLLVTHTIAPESTTPSCNPFVSSVFCILSPVCSNSYDLNYADIPEGIEYRIGLVADRDESSRKGGERGGVMVERAVKCVWLQIPIPG